MDEMTARAWYLKFEYTRHVQDFEDTQDPILIGSANEIDEEHVFITNGEHVRLLTKEELNDFYNGELGFVQYTVIAGVERDVYTLQSDLTSHRH